LMAVKIAAMMINRPAYSTNPAPASRPRPRIRETTVLRHCEALRLAPVPVAVIEILAMVDPALPHDAAVTVPASMGTVREKTRT
jgi:hypothetical protein